MLIVNISQLEKLETKLNVERQANQRELENILKEKAAEIEEAKLEAEKNTSGIQKLYESLKVPGTFHGPQKIYQRICLFMLHDIYLLIV